jgi:hypothetical protein
MCLRVFVNQPVEAENDPATESDDRPRQIDVRPPQRDQLASASSRAGGQDDEHAELGIDSLRQAVERSHLLGTGRHQREDR